MVHYLFHHSASWGLFCWWKCFPLRGDCARKSTDEHETTRCAGVPKQRIRMLCREPWYPITEYSMWTVCAPHAGTSIKNDIRIHYQKQGKRCQSGKQQAIKILLILSSYLNNGGGKKEKHTWQRRRWQGNLKSALDLWYLLELKILLRSFHGEHEGTMSTVLIHVPTCLTIWVNCV